MGPANAIAQANILAAELRKAGAFCRSTRIVVTDENDQRIFERQPLMIPIFCCSNDRFWRAAPSSTSSKCGSVTVLPASLNLS